MIDDPTAALPLLLLRAVSELICGPRAHHLDSARSLIRSWAWWAQDGQLAGVWKVGLGWQAEGKLANG